MQIFHGLPPVSLGRPFRGWHRLFAVVLAALMIAAVAPPAGAAQGSPVVVVGDSILLAAAEEITASFPGRPVVVDAEVGRPTNVGLDVIRQHRGSITDTLVVGLGANDGATPSIFRPRVEAILAEVSDVAHVYWVEVAEVRSYYPTTNAIVREVAARYPNVTIIPWSADALANSNWTGSDGLHLTAAGQHAMAERIANAVNGVAFLQATAQAIIDAGPPPLAYRVDPLSAIVESSRAGYTALLPFAAGRWDQTSAAADCVTPVVGFAAKPHAASSRVCTPDP